MRAIGLFLVVVALAWCAFADDDDCCSAEDRREIQFIWEKIWQSAFTARRLTIADAVFDYLFKHYPSAKEVFKRVNVDTPESPEFKAHLIRVTNGLDTIIGLLDNTQVLDEHLEHLASQHKARKGVTKEYFKGIGEAFEHVLPQVSTCFNVDAWNRCFHRAAERISKDLP